jgi:HEAT repeat protein
MHLLLVATRLYLCWALWDWLGLASPGRALVKALGSQDKNLQSIAGILLVKSGKRAEPLLQDAVNRRENLPTVLTVLGSIGDLEIAPQLRKFTEDQNPEVARAAQKALKVVEFSGKA